MTNFGTATWVDELLGKLVAQIVSRTGFPADCVFESVAPDSEHLQFPPSDRFVTIFPGNFPVDTPGVSGGGRLTTGFDGVFTTTLFTRIASDQEKRSTRLFRDAANGVAVNQKKLLDALQMFSPANSAGAVLLKEPARILSFAFMNMHAKDGSPWATVKSSWSLKFVSDIPAS